MSERDRNEDREYRRRERDDRGFFEQARDWIRGESDDDEDRQRNRDRQDYDRSRQWRGDEDNRSTYRGARAYGEGDREFTRDYNRDYQDPRDYRDQPVNRDQNEYSRGRRYFGQGSGQGYSQRNPNRDEEGYRGRQHFRYARDFGSEYSDPRHDDDYADEGRDFRRGGYNQGLSRGRYGSPYNRNQSDWDFEEQMRRTYGSEESGRDYTRRSGQPYPSAGMRSDFGSDYNYENEYGEDRWTGRGRSGTYEYNSRFPGTGRFQRGSGQSSQAGRSTGAGRYGDRERSFDRDYSDSDYIGYEREGAFYQDLDEPYTYEYWEIWMVPGEFTGMGPSNYQRSDERIHEEVCERLTRHGRVDASQVDVEVKNGEVFLRGQVPSRDMKRLAEDTADGITGVKNVHNEIRVPKRQQEMRSQEQQWQRAREISSGDHNRDNQEWSTGRQAGQMDTSRYEANREGMSGASTAETGGSSQVDTTSRVTGQQATGGQTSSQARTGRQSGGMEATSSGPGQVSPQTEKRTQLRQGMEVIGKNGKVIGRVKEIRASDFLVDREMARDVYVPMDSIESVGAQAMLKIADDEVDNQDWEKPDIV